MVDTEAAAGKKASKATNDKTALRVVSRAMWRAELAPKATADQKKASWQEGRSKYTASAKRFLKALQQHGGSVIVVEQPAKGVK